MKHLKRKLTSTRLPSIFQGVFLLILFDRHTCLATKSRLVIGGLVGIDIDQEGWSSAGVMPAIELALERVNNYSNILKDYYLDIEWKDSGVKYNFESCIVLCAIWLSGRLIAKHGSFLCTYDRTVSH